MRIDIPIVDIPELYKNTSNKFLIFWEKFVNQSYELLFKIATTLGGEVIIGLAIVIVYGLFWGMPARLIIFLFLILCLDVCCVFLFSLPQLVYLVTGVGLVILTFIHRASK